MAQSLDIVDKFSTDICLELRCQLIYRARKHEVLPHEQTKLVAGVEEPVLRIVAAAPYAHRVKVCSLAVQKKLSRALLGRSSEQVLLRDIVGAHREHGLAVYLMGKALAPLVFLDMHRHCAQTDALLPGVKQLSGTEQLHLHSIQRLIAKSVRPPQLRAMDLDGLRISLICL